MIAGEITGGSLNRPALGRHADGVLLITGDQHSYTGETNLQAGTTLLQSNARLASTSLIRIGRGAVLVLDNRSDGNSTDRLGDHVPLTMEGGLLIVDMSRDEFTSESMGSLTFSENVSRIEIPGDRELSGRWQFASLAH